MFDIVALQSVTVTNFDIDAYGNMHTYEIYHKPGSHVGSENNPGAWTLLGTANNVPGNPRNSPTSIPITIGASMCGGETHAFYITSTGASGSISYTDGTGVGTVAAADANIQILQGTGKDYAFGMNFTPRTPNVTVYYSCTSSCCTPPTLSSTPTSCSGQCDGTATATVGAGGVPPYTYLWDASAGNQTTQTASGLCAGTYSVDVTDATGCVATGTVTVADGPQSANATITPVGPFCETAGSVTLSAANGGGIWSGPGITNASAGTFDPATAGPGTHTITYTIGGVCGDVQTTTITVNALADATIIQTGPYCVSDPPVNLTAATGGGIWTGTGILNSNTGLFDPGTAGPGTWTMLYQITGTCGGFDSESITVVSSSDATIYSAGPFCTGDAPIDLTAASAGGTWAGPGIIDPVNGTFDPSAAGTGTATVTYTITGSCGGSDDQPITVSQSSDATIDPAGPFCLSDPAVQLTAADGGGTWTGAGITNSSTGMFNPASAGLGTWTIVYNIPGSCGDFQTSQITVTNAADATITPVGFLCTTSSPVNLVAADAGGTWSGTGIVDPIAGTFDPSVSGPGSHVVTYTLGGSCGDSDTEIVFVLQGNDATIDPIDTICTTDPPFNFTAASGGGTWGGIGITNPFTGAFNPAAVNPGTWVVNYSISGQCGDSDSQSFVVVEGGYPTIDPVTPVCPSDAAFNLAASVTGGTWSGTGITDPTNGTFDPTVAGPGNHTVTYSTPGACGGTATETVQVSSAIILATSLDQQSNCGQADGVASVSASGGTVSTDYNYSWNTSPAQTAASATGLLPGTYTVTVSDDLNCTATADATVSATTGFTASISSFENVSCNQACDGEATVLAGTGNTPPLTYSWNTNPVQTAATATGLCPGTYAVTVSDNVGCTATASATITEPAALGLTAFTSAAQICIGSSSTLIAGVSGGTPGYSFAWSASPADPTLNPTLQNPTVFPVVNTTYTITATDANGCTITDQVDVEVASPLQVTTTLDQQSNCGQADGVASASVTGGIAPNGYSYSWNTTPEQTTATATGLAAGTYTVTVTDDASCTATETVTVTTSAGFTASISNSTDVSCYQLCDGEATATVSAGAIPPLTYSWNTTPVQTSATASNLCAGNYSVTITDNAGCQASTNVTIVEPAELTVSALASQLSICNGETTDLSATTSGGTPNLSYNWLASPADGTLNASQQNPTVSPTLSTDYTVTVTDANGCSASDQVSITASDAIVLATNLDQPSNCGQPDGIVSVSASGGTIATDYTYSWDSNPVQTTAIASNLTPGTYNVSVTDDLGCTETASILLTSTAGFTVDIVSTTDASCYQGCDGEAMAVAGVGSVAPVSYSWSSNPIQTSATATGLCAGVYDVTVTDATGCSATSAVTIGEASELTATASATDPIICSGQSTTLNANGLGGTGPYASYQWSSVPADPSLNATDQNPILSPTTNTTYTVQITDANGCTATALTTVDISPAISLNLTLDNESVCAQPDGSASVSATGGIVSSDYTYSWNTAPTQPTSTASGLAPGMYSVTVYDDLGCSAIDSIEVTTVGGFQASVGSQTDVSCFGQCDGTATAVASGTALQPVTYAWDASAGGQTSQTATGLCPGTYEVVLTDAGTCTDTTEVTITEPTLLEVIAGVGQSPICSGDAALLATAPSGGTAPYNSFVWTANPADPTLVSSTQNPSVSPLVTTDYTVVVTDANGCSATDMTTVEVAPAISVSATMDQEAVCGLPNGSASVSATGGIVATDYNYSWNTTPTQTTATVTGLSAGNYTVTITDDLGCAGTASVDITEPLLLSVTASAIETEICYGESSVLNATESGGTPPITSYNWTAVPADASLVSTDASPTVSPLVSTVYTVEITDANGCTATADVTVNVSSAIALTTSEDQPSSCGVPDGVVSVSASGGTVSTDYGYSWNSTPVQTTVSATGLTPGDYEVTVTDDYGCSETASITLTQTAGFTASISSYTDALCYQQCDGEATVIAYSGNTPPLNYSWNTIPIQSGATATGLCAGTYQVTIVDAVGCQATTTVDIAEPTELTAIASATDSSLCIGETSQLSVTGSGGTEPYSGYYWTATPADASLVATDQNPTVSPISSTNYQATVTDANGCTSSAQVPIQVLSGLTVNVIRPTANPDTAICPGEQATIDLDISGGDGNYTVYLLPDINAPIALPIQVQPNNTTTYVFEVIDGCTTPSAPAQSTITINEIPTIEFSADEPNGCDIHQVQFTDNTSPSPVGWNWNFGDANSGNNTATAPVTSHTYSGPGTYDVSLSIETAEGCVTDTVISTMIEVYPLPTAQFTADPLSTTSLDPKITYTDESSSDVVSWFWDFGTGDTSDLQNPEYMYMDTGEFITWLTVTNIFGCEATTRVGIRIAPSFTFYIPNAFTPNGDGHNETFRPYGEGVDWDSFHMSIYNRWGEEIYTTNNIEKPWDGTFKGRPVEQYVYVYSISIRALDGRLYTYRDGFTLVR